MTEGPTCVAVIGCGLIGASWTALLLAHGHDVVVWDPAASALEGFEKRVEPMRATVRRVRSRNPGREGRLSVAARLHEAVRGAAFIQENAPESIALKIALYEEIENAAPASAILASSTSSLTWSALSPRLRRAGRFITAHPFNPPHLIPLVEIYGVDAEIVAQASTFYASLDRKPVVLKRDATGHIANRLASALWREAVNIVAEGIADVSAVDAAMVHGPGLRWSIVGAHMAYHLGGGAGGLEQYLRALGPSQERRWADLGAPRLTPQVCEQLVEGIKAEAAGRSIAELEALRDAALMEAIAARRDGHGYVA